MRSVSACDTVWVSERERGCCVRVGEWAADTGPGSDTEEGELVRKKQRTTLLFKHVGQEGRKVWRWKSARSDQGEKLECSTRGVFWEMCTIWESLHEGLTYRASLSLVLVRVKSMEEMEGREVLCPLHLQKNAQDLDDQDQQTSRCVCPACQAGLSEGSCIKRWLCTRVGLIHWTRFI